jgi:hypothetical protein
MLYKFLVLSLFAAAVGGQMTQTMRNRILSDHNEKRRTATNAANMIELQYDMVLEQVAQAYLNRGCAGGFQHNPNRGCDYTARGGTHGGTGTCASVGENWYSGYTDNTTGVDVVIGGAVAQWTDGRCSSWASPPLRCNSYWCSEKQNFYQTGSDSYGACSQTSGEVLHYTQLMWATTAYVGCGYTAACGTLCDYAMAGNMNLPSMGSMREANIWKIGTPCSSCPSGYTKCNNGLCSATTSTSSTPTTTPAPRCAPDTTSKPTNGNIGTCGTSTAVGSYCTQTCNTGYTLTSGSLSRQCKTGGIWASTTAVCSASSTPAPASSAGYCISGVGPLATDDTELGAVLLVGNGNQISDSNGCPGTVGPTILTSLSTTLLLGRTYTLSVERTTCGDWYVALVGAWIDWNQDKVWSDSEKLFTYSQQTGTLTFSFTVPSTARLGTTRMRVQAQEISSYTITTMNPCAAFQWGDTKDYTIVVASGTAAEEAQISAAPVCIPDNVAPVNGSVGTCTDILTLGSTCAQACNYGFNLRAGTSLERECTANGFSNSTAICE